MTTLRTCACACGLPITANPLDPFPGVSAHVEGRTHRAWSDHTSWHPRPAYPDPTAAGTVVDVSGRQAVRPVRARRRGRLVGRRVA